MFWPGYRNEANHIFYNVEYQTKKDIANFDHAQVDHTQVAWSIKAGDLLEDPADSYARYGREIPNSILNSMGY